MAELWTSVAGWWLRLAIAGGVVLLIGLLLMRLVRQPARRQQIGTWAVIAALIVVPLSMLPGWLPLPWSAPTAVVKPESPPPIAPQIVAPAPPEAFWQPPAVKAAPAVPHGPRNLAPPLVTVAPAAPQTPAVAQAAPATPSIDWGRVGAWTANGLLSIYVLTAVVLVCWLAAGQIALIRLWRSGRAPSPEVRRLFRPLARQMARRPALRVSSSVSSPICFGIVRPKVLLPESLADSGDTTALRWALAHELCHAERKDAQVAWLAGLAQALFWFCPWLGALRRELRLSQEYLADAAAIGVAPSTDSRPEEYADFLVRLTRTRPVPVGASGVRAGSSDLFRRIAMLLKSESLEPRCSRRWSVLAGVGMLSAALVLGGVYLRPALAADAPKPAEKADKKADQAKLTPEERRKQLEEKIKKLDLNSPEYAQAMKEFEKLLEAEKPVQPEPRIAPAFPDRGIPADALRRLEEQRRLANEQLRKMVEDMQRGGLGGLDNDFFNLNPLLRERQNDGRLGVRIEKPSPVLVEQLNLPEGQGLVVTDVRPGSPAEQAGIKANDVLLMFAGQAVPSDAARFARQVREVKANEAVDIEVMRKGKKETLKGIKMPEQRAQGPQLFGLDGLPNANLFRPFDMPGGGVPILRNPRLRGGVDGANVARRSVEVNNNDFVIRSEENSVAITIKGTKDGDNKTVTGIEIKDGKSTITATAMDKVPEKYREQVKNLLESVK